MPHFHVSETKQGKTPSTGYIDYELQGTLDRMDGVTEGGLGCYCRNGIVSSAT
jgi:hypothetical protein